MMFHEAQVFEGLTAWFSASVPARLKSKWVKNGGLHSSDFNDADYIFSSNAAAKDTISIFDSQTYQNEELTIFNSSLIEDTVSEGKNCLNGKYAGAYILIDAAYQKEIDSFHKEKCPRLYSNANLAKKEDSRQSGHNNTSHKVKNNVKQAAKQSKHNQDSDEWEFEDNPSRQIKKCNEELSDDEQSDEWDFKDESAIKTSENIGSLTREHHQIIEDERTDEWDFNDSTLHMHNLRDARQLGGKTVECDDRRDAKLVHSSQRNSNSAAVKRARVEPLPSREQDVRDLCDNPSVTFSCLSDRERNSLQSVDERESFVDNKASSNAPASSRSHFHSSMDDGFVHIDDITLPDTPIYDFIPYQNGCRVDPK